LAPHRFRASSRPPCRATLRPAGDVWRKLVFREWWTTEAGQTAANGEYTVRGFLINYEVEVRAGGKTKTERTRVDPAGALLEIALP
jgi:hypothetical protein